MHLKQLNWRAWYPEFAGYLAFGLALEWLLVAGGYLSAFSTPVLLMAAALALVFSAVRWLGSRRGSQNSGL